MLFLNKKYFILLILLYSSNSFSRSYKIKCEHKRISALKFIEFVKELDSRYSNFESKRLLAKSYILGSVWNSIEYCADDVKNKKIPRLYSELRYGSRFFYWGNYENNPKLSTRLSFKRSQSNKDLNIWRGRTLAPIINRKLLIDGLAILKRLKKNYPFSGDPKKSWSYVDNLTLAWVYENLEDYKNAIKFYSTDYENKHGCTSGSIECYSFRRCDMKKIVLEAFSSQIRIFTIKNKKEKILELKNAEDTYRKKAKSFNRPRLPLALMKNQKDRDC